MVKRALRYLGHKVIGRAVLLHSFWRIAVVSLGSFVFRFRRNRAAADVLLKQIYFTGFQAIPIISWIAVILGLVIVTQSLSILPKVGGEHMIGEVLVWVVVRELGPVFASVIVIARSGTAIAAELGSMRISREITALEVMGIDPVRYLVMPRVIGTAVSVFVLTFYFETVTILGGYLLAGFGKRVAFPVYISSVLESMGFLEVGASLLKSVLFGLIIGVVCSAHGLMVEKSITRIPQETTNAVIGSLRLVFVMDAVITFMFFYI
ncbi:MAG: ABC transporter permease [Deltaproteobacteria bacterium]|nr:ABC transporter permease [Deltaproteobacteria bacterium]